MANENFSGLKEEGYSTLVLTRGNTTSVYDFDSQIVAKKVGDDVRVYDGPWAFNQAVDSLRERSEQLHRMASTGSVRSFKIGDLEVSSGMDVKPLINNFRRIK